MSKEAEKRPPYYNYVRYSGLAIQMAAIVLFFVYLGIWLDKRTASSRPWFTALFAVIGVASSVYFAIRDLIRK